MKVLVTGSAGFIGAHVCNRLMSLRSFEVIGLDCFNSYYDVRLKRARAAFLTPGMPTLEVDITDSVQVKDSLEDLKPDVVVHLAAQAGVRHSFEKPMDYVNSNLVGHMSMLEGIRSLPSVKRFIYASSSSVYSGVKELPFSEATKLGTPKSLYAATKIADEIFTETYADLFDFDAIGLRFFTVYGPWGRPDMAYWGFANAILTGREIKLYNFGDVRRDFTYIDDVSEVINKMVLEASSSQGKCHRTYNVGNHSPEPVSNLIEILEDKLGKRARVSLAPLPPGDMVETYADVEKLQSDYGFAPSTPLSQGVSRFADWFMDWRSGDI